MKRSGKSRIYIITCTKNNKVYVGKTKNTIKVRFKQHMSSSHNIMLSNDILFFGKDKFKIKLLEFCSHEESGKREIYWIAKFNSIYPKGYNQTAGGHGGNTYSFVSSEQKEIRAAAGRVIMKERWKDPEYIEYQKNLSLGIKRSEETKTKISEAAKEHGNRPEIKAKRRASQIFSLYRNRMIKILGSSFGD